MMSDDEGALIRAVVPVEISANQQFNLMGAFHFFNEPADEGVDWEEIFGLHLPLHKESV